MPARDRVGVDLERVDAVLQRVLRADRDVRQLAGLARRDEADAEPVGERGAEHEAACLGAQDHVRLARLDPGCELLDRLVQGCRVAEERHDVLEDDAPLREIGHVTDVVGEIDCHVCGDS